MRSVVEAKRKVQGDTFECTTELNTEEVQNPTENVRMSKRKISGTKFHAR